MFERSACAPPARRSPSSVGVTCVHESGLAGCRPVQSVKDHNAHRPRGLPLSRCALLDVSMNDEEDT